MEKIEEDAPDDESTNDTSITGYDKLTTSKVAKSLGIKIGELTDDLVSKGLLERDGDKLKLTDKGNLMFEFLILDFLSELLGLKSLAPQLPVLTWTTAGAVDNYPILCYR